MTAMWVGFELTLYGMGLVFLLLAMLWGLIALLLRFDKPEAAVEAVEEVASAAEDVPTAEVAPKVVPLHEELPPGLAGTGAVKAPMPGTVTAVDVKAGETVTAGQVLFRLEGMKMVNAIKAPRDGVAEEVRVQAGESVGYGHVLVILKEA